jgi:hypothetical protein
MNAPTLLLAALAATSLAAEASAQNCWLRNTFRIANSYSGSSSELNVNTGMQTTRPLITNGANNNPGATCYSQGSCNLFTDYGYLHATGSGSASNCATSGTFLYLDQGPQAQFSDLVAVGSTTLPHGTPVQVRMTLALGGHATMQDGNPAVWYEALCYSGSTTLQLTNSNGTVSGIVQTYVGSALNVHCWLSFSLYAYGLLGLGIPPQTATYSLDLTARVGLEVLTPGAMLTACSGVTYSTMTAAVANVGGGCGASSPTQNASPPRLAQTQTYTSAGAPANEAVFLAFASGPAISAPLGPCIVTEDPNQLVLAFMTVSDAAGAASFGLGIPNSPALAGDRFTTQLLVLSAGGPLLGIGQLSNGLTCTIGL